MGAVEAAPYSPPREVPRLLLLKLQATMTRHFSFVCKESRPGRAALGFMLVLTFQECQVPAAPAFGGDSEGRPPNLVLGLAKDTQ